VIASAQTLQRLQPLTPFLPRTRFEGVSFGLSSAGYDIRIDQDAILKPHEFFLASTVERFNMPLNLLGIVHDKSTWARVGLAVQNTVIEPGWAGHLTIELTNHGYGILFVKKGVGIAQVIFHLLDVATDQPYEGKYQDQANKPVAAIFERPVDVIERSE